MPFFIKPDQTNIMGEEVVVAEAADEYVYARDGACGDDNNDDGKAKEGEAAVAAVLAV